MNLKRSKIGRHVLIITGISALITLCIVYPFLSGQYDRLAVPLSTMAQVFGVVGLPLSLLGLFWLVMPTYKFAFAILATVVSTLIVLVLALFATLSIGNSFGILTLATLVYTVIRLIPKIKQSRKENEGDFNPAPLYMIILPILTLFFQVISLGPVTQWSRDRAVSNAQKFIEDIEKYRKQHGHYPLFLQAQNKDYHPDVVGVERYYYAPYGEGYNLSFEQPRFLLDRFGTREWVVYNPLDEHRVYSHIASLLPTKEIEPSQGWYASGDTGHLHWKYFLFD